MEPAQNQQSLTARLETVLPPGTRVGLFANTDWYLHNFRLSLATALRNSGCEVILIAPAGPYVERFEQLGFRFIPFAFNRLSLNPLEQASAVCRLATLYRRERLDIAHHFTIKCAVYGSLAVRLVGRSVAVNAFAGLGSVFAERAGRFRITRRIVIETLRRAISGTHVIVQNPDDRNLLAQHRVMSPDLIRLIRGSGVDLERFVIRREPSAGAKLRVLLASRLIRSKGIGAFEEVARRLRPSTGAEFLLAGAPDPGNPDSLTSEELQGVVTRGHVSYLGHVEDIPDLLSTVDLVVLPTTYGEGVPRILIEAAAAGLPLVANDVPGCREIVRPSVNGELVVPGDVEGLTAAIASLLLDDSKRRSMGQQSLEIAESFSAERVIDETVRVYLEALHSGGRRVALGNPGL